MGPDAEMGSISCIENTCFDYFEYFVICIWFEKSNVITKYFSNFVFKIPQITLSTNPKKEFTSSTLQFFKFNRQSIVGV